MSESIANRDEPADEVPWVTRVFALSFGPVASIAGTIGIFVAAWAARALLDPMLPPGFPFLTFFPAVVLTAFLFGLRAGILSAILCGAVAWYFFIPPVHSLRLEGAEVALGLYVFVVATDLALLHGMRVANLRLREERRIGLELAAAKERAAQALEERAAELHAAFDALRESEVKTHLATQTAGIGIWQWHVPSGKVYWDDTMFALYGMAPTPGGELVHQDFMERMHPDDLPSPEELGKMEIDTLQTTKEFRIRRVDDGQVRHIRAVEVARPGPDGRTEWVVGTNLDITDEKERENHIRLLLGEVNHRAKNLLAVVLSVAKQTRGTDHKAFLKNFAARIQSLSAGQDLLVKNAWRGVGLGALIEAQLGHFKDLLGERILLEGEDLPLSASAVQTLGMTLHELLTNASKYGALSGEAGQVRLAWQRSGAAGAERFVMTWTETGGPAPQPSDHRGFGSVVTGDMVRSTLEAEVVSSFAPTGFTWQLECALAHIIETEEA